LKRPAPGLVVSVALTSRSFSRNSRAALPLVTLVGSGGSGTLMVVTAETAQRSVRSCPEVPAYRGQPTGRRAGVAPLSDLVKRSAPFLPTGSQIRQAFICQAAPSFAFFLITYATGLTMFWIKYRCVAVTQDAIYVLDSSRLSGGAKPTLIVGTLPRHTQLGPVSGRWGQLDLLGERHWVHKRFHAEITAADADAGFTYPPQ